jgi:hydroxymethylpyrimidine pyrophosphatase-like HAD family hydrolase
MLFSKILKNIKLVVFDVDGTLLNDDGKIGEETKDLVKELRRFDVRFSFASGRLHSAITKYAEELILIYL